MNARGMGQTKLDHILASSHGADHFSVWSRDESTPYGSGVAIIGPRSMATTALKFGELPGYLLAYRFKRGDAGDLIIICIYLPHNNGDQRRQAVLAKLAEVTQELLDDDLVVVGGDFNAAFSPSEDRDPTTVETNNDDDSNDDDNDDDDELSQEELIARTRTDPECEVCPDMPAPPPIDIETIIATYYELRSKEPRDRPEDRVHAETMLLAMQEWPDRRMIMCGYVEEAVLRRADELALLSMFHPAGWAPANQPDQERVEDTPHPSPTTQTYWAVATILHPMNQAQDAVWPLRCQTTAETYPRLLYHGPKPNPAGRIPPKPDDTLGLCPLCNAPRGPDLPRAALTIWHLATRSAGTWLATSRIYQIYF